MLAITNGDIPVMARAVANSINENIEPAPRPVETTPSGVYTLNEVPPKKSLTSDGGEVPSATAGATVQPLLAEQPSPPLDLTAPVAVTAASEPGSSVRVNAAMNADATPKQSFWARMKKLVIGR